ncbi:type II toxin-antitoxin system VapC family toxin [Candidatus Bathyarchaeota archaeon]|nr:type II toxin-antitoxin system VapC family toxin [Candidatus Bathyarchaeota archaeon]
MNAFETYLGAFRSRMVERNVKQADDLLNSIKILELTLETSRKASEILSRLIRKGEPIDLRDAIIAGIALTNGYTLITRNTEYFKKITGLSIETW